MKIKRLLSVLALAVIAAIALAVFAACNKTDIDNEPDTGDDYEQGADADDNNAQTPDTDGNYVQVPEAEVIGIEIIKEPATTIYYVGETFTSEGLELKVTYDDNTTDTVTSGFIASASTAMAGDITVTVKYFGKTDTFTITVCDKLTGLLVGGASRYAVGEEFGGVTVSALYNGKTADGKELDGSDYEMNIEPALSDGKFGAAGKYTVTVGYGEEKIDGKPLSAEQTFTVTVTDPADPALIEWGEEGQSVGSWKYWVDDNENNAIITDAEVRVTEEADGVDISAVFSSTGASDYGFQLFYNYADYAGKLGRKYTLTLAILSQSDCAVVINGENYLLSAGVPKDVETTFTYSYNGEYTGMSLFDMQVKVAAGENYDLTLSNIRWEEVDPDISGGGTGGEVGGADYVVELTKTEVYNGMYAKLYMSAADLEYIRANAAKVVINGSYTGADWSKKGFLVDGTVCIQVRLIESGTASGDFTLTWYDGDGKPIATCSFTA